MACEVCEHCQNPLSQHDPPIIREGHSYHRQCHKCYVCSETDLHDAEVFKGVIFCYSCSKRIFQGISTARHSKAPRRTRTKSRSRRKRYDRSPTNESHSRHQLQRESGVIELARRGHVTNTDSSSVQFVKTPSKRTAMDVATQGVKEVYHNKSSDMKKDSLEMGTTTVFNQELMVNNPVACNWKKAESTPLPVEKLVSNARPAQPPKRRSFDDAKKPSHKKTIWSDLRVAELGQSTEIANMALRKHSKDTEKLTSKTVSPARASLETGADRGKSILSVLTDDKSREVLEEWLDSAYQHLSARQSIKRRFVNRPIKSIIYIPFRYFKTRILDRSSLISVLAGEETYKYTIFSKLKMLFHEEINDHHKRGIKTLYSTVNRRKVPYRLGWLHVETHFPTGNGSMNYHGTQNNSYISRNGPCQICGRCKHYRRSHSYRCLRAQVMRLAGPTKSQLALIRKKLRGLLSFNFFRSLNYDADDKSSIASEIGSYTTTVILSERESITNERSYDNSIPTAHNSVRKCSTL